jgi:hypothetical protein
MDVFFTVLLAVGAVLCIRLLQNHLHEAKLLRFREMAHSERMKALERDLPLPDNDSEVLNELLRGGSERGALSAEARAAKERLIRMAALCLGLTSFLGGLGLTFGLHVQADSEIAGLWGIGLIPTLIGVGLLLFVRLLKNFEQPDASHQDSA